MKVAKTEEKKGIKEENIRTLQEKYSGSEDKQEKDLINVGDGNIYKISTNNQLYTEQNIAMSIERKDRENDFL